MGAAIIEMGVGGASQRQRLAVLLERASTRVGSLSRADEDSASLLFCLVALRLLHESLDQGEWMGDDWRILKDRAEGSLEILLHADEVGLCREMIEHVAQDCHTLAHLLTCEGPALWQLQEKMTRLWGQANHTQPRREFDSWLMFNTIDHVRSDTAIFSNTPPEPLFPSNHGTC